MICVPPLPVPEHGFIGYSSWLLSSNTMPDYTPGENFFTVFGVFFPAATGEVYPNVNAFQSVTVFSMKVTFTHM